MLNCANAVRSNFAGAVCFVFCAVLSACGSRGEESVSPDAAAYPPAPQLDGGPIAAEWPWRDGPLAWHEWDETVQSNALREELLADQEKMSAHILETAGAHHTN